MAGPQFSGVEVYNALVNVGNFKVVNVTGDHVGLAKHPPDHHDTEPKYVRVPLHDELAIGTLQSVADQAGAKEYRELLRLDRAEYLTLPQPRSWSSSRTSSVSATLVFVVHERAKGGYFAGFETAQATHQIPIAAPSTTPYTRCSAVPP